MEAKKIWERAEELAWKHKRDLKKAAKILAVEADLTTGVALKIVREAMLRSLGI